MFAQFGLLLLTFWSFGTCQEAPNGSVGILGDEFWAAVEQHENHVATLSPSPESSTSHRVWNGSSDERPRPGRVAPRVPDLAPERPPRTLTRGERRGYEVKFRFYVLLLS